MLLQRTSLFIAPESVCNLPENPHAFVTVSRYCACRGFQGSFPSSRSRIFVRRKKEKTMSENRLNPTVINYYCTNPNSGIFFFYYVFSIKDCGDFFFLNRDFSRTYKTCIIRSHILYKNILVPIG